MKVLIVKLSSLGDVVHAMAAVQDMRRALPQLQVDWVVERGFAPLVARCAGVRRVIACDLRQWRKKPFAASTRRAWAAFKTDLQAEAYDAVIDVQGLSKSALVAYMARLTPQGRRYGMANQTEGSGFEAPARWVAHVALTMPFHVHAVQRARLLCAQALGYADSGVLDQAASFGLQALADVPPERRGVVALVHGTSRADKQWPLDSWVALARALQQQGQRVALVHGSLAEQATSEAIAAQLSDVQVWPLMPLDALTDHLAACAGVVGVDSGVSHMAVALNLPHVQIYNFDTAWRTGPDRPHQRCVYAQPAPSVAQVLQAWQAVLSQEGA